ncbi:hypothetical protein WG66_013882 [Moniliophthora roreri]|nr:hypothetical protein WG66_013882 [Moniliophthora roreri]
MFRGFARFGLVTRKSHGARTADGIALPSWEDTEPRSAVLSASARVSLGVVLHCYGLPGMLASDGFVAHL